MKKELITSQITALNLPSVCVTIKREQTKFGPQEVAVVSCPEANFDQIINIAVQHGLPHERFINAFGSGVKIFL